MSTPELVDADVQWIRDAARAEMNAHRANGRLHMAAKVRGQLSRAIAGIRRDKTAPVVDEPLKPDFTFPISRAVGWHIAGLDVRAKCVLGAPVVTHAYRDLAPGDVRDLINVLTSAVAHAERITADMEAGNDDWD